MHSACLACRAPIDDTDRFCAACGAPVSSAMAVTGTAAPPRLAAAAGRFISSDAIPVGGFTPGAVIADRYRIIGLLGRGGMGEVYRADDLKLGQAVALKFLPPDLAGDPVRRERFFAEVRIARQISHPNVCRVYDIAEFDGRHFLSMEYVDGEDLASLLKRIGHLPGAKAVEIARQLCAGVAAAHEKGVLHRDLKPANVMLDGRGRVRITDFGLAVAMDQAHDEWLISGTPAYMAPEQLAGEPATVRSDIYALGLVLYELYTGRRAFTASSLAELRIQKEQETPTAPSEISRDLDPLVERVIQRCIDKDPRARPVSVLQVAAALPGGDPLAAALAAGETPSPEMVAASSSHEGLRPAVAWALLTVVVAGVALSVMLGKDAVVFQRVPLELPPAAMVERAREIARAAGHVAPPADSAYGVFPNGQYLRHVEQNDPGPRQWEGILPEATGFWYRQSSRPLMRTSDIFPGVTETDPPREDSGDVTVRLDARGQLRDITAIPPQVVDAAVASPPVDWPALFRAAGIEFASATAVTPEWAPLYYGDSREAWLAAFPGAPSIRTRIEAASFAGQAVNFFVIPPWQAPTRVSPRPVSTGELVSNLVAVSMLGLLLAGGLLFARRNLRMGRGDRRGATRLALFVLGALMVTWLVGEDHAVQFWELYLFVSWTGFALFAAGLLWLLYVAVEPYIRRNAPGMLVSWSRLLAGGFSDPLVGRDVLLGCAVGSAGIAVSYVTVLLPTWIGRPAESLSFSPPVIDAPSLIVQAVFLAALALFEGLAILFLLFLARLVLRRQVLAVAAVTLVLAVPAVLNAVNPVLLLPVLLVGAAMLVVTLARVGLLAAVVAVYTAAILNAAPAVLPFGAWHAGLGATMIGIIVALALYGFYRSLAGRPVLGALGLDA
jgi:serine/threonine-protein kinase